MTAVTCGPVAAAAQTVCAGDLDGDGVLTSTDVDLARPLLFDAERAALLGYLADVNGDGTLSGADVVALVKRRGTLCQPATATPRPSATPTPTRVFTRPPSPSVPTQTFTPTATRTRTSTPTLTPTATPRCVVQPLAPGATMSGTIAPGDCTRLVGGVLRLVDAYEIAASPGSAVRVEVSSPSGGLASPWVAVVDPNGQFGFGHGRPPVEWTVVQGQPYLVYVTSDPGFPQQTGAYQVRVTTRACPTPRAVNLAVGFSLSNLRLSSSDCPEPNSLGTNGQIDPAHAYTFQVTTVPTQVDIVMRQLVEDDPLDPTFVVLGPDGVEVVPSEQVDDAAGGPLGIDAGARFLAIRPGTYTLLTSGGEGRYSLVVTSPRCPTTSLSNIPPDRPFVCPGQSGPGCQGTLYGSRTGGTCGAPLPVFADEETPLINAGANAFTFAAQRGDLVSVGLEIDGDDGFALLLGPASDGNPIVAYDSSAFTESASTQLSATIVRGGTYTLLLGNVNPLAPPEPSAGDPGDVVPYSFFLQKCLASGVITPGSGQALQSTFRVTDCFGTGQTPHRVYVVPGQAGQFLMVEMEGDPSVDPGLKLWALDGSVSENAGDPFGNPSVARVARLLPADGDYLLEVFSSPDNGEFDPTGTNSFRVQARTCATQSIGPGLSSFNFSASDCRFASGQPYKVFTWRFDGGPGQVASFSASDGVCLQALLPNGEAIPAYSCALNWLEVPMVAAGNYALIVAASSGELPPSVVVAFRQCALARTLTFGDLASGSLSSASCQAADGVRADWYWLTAGENLLRFNQGIGGSIESAFRPMIGFTDALGSTERGGIFAGDPPTMLRLAPGNRSALVRVRSAGSLGSYVLTVDSAIKRH
ncbi:MAG: hypothetical protein KatS3mg077_2658 [Candidatus Binatia bacterium]|nr:MAG: hypothetical protein KatS3mg077_2658 [Candidatus Binatia bacterium]